MQKQILFKLAVCVIFGALVSAGVVQARTGFSNGGFLTQAGESGAMFAAFGDWELRSKRIGVDHTEYIRFNRVTGEAYRLTDEWQKVGETAPVPKGDYDVVINGDAADKNWSAMRIDKVTGKCWWLIGASWTLINDKKP